MEQFKTFQERYPTITIREAAAFTLDGTGGNMAGVTIDLKNELNYEVMQEVSAKFGYSESAFIQKSDKADFRLLFFTPTNRVKMCGHATIAAWGTMFKNGLIHSGIYTQEVIDENGDSQILNIEVSEDGSVFTNLDLPKDPETIDRNFLNDHLNYGDSKLPTQIINTGFKDLMIPVSLEVFNSIDYSKVDRELLLNIQKTFNVEGLHMFALDDSEGEFKIYAKNTDPINGIYPYDDATGTSNGALAAYLYINKLVTQEKLTPGTSVTQIGAKGKKSKVLVKIVFDDDGQIMEIKVGGEVK